MPPLIPLLIRLRCDPSGDADQGPARPTGGCGAVAVLVGPDAPLVVDMKTRASYACDVWDFFKPDMDSEYPRVRVARPVPVFHCFASQRTCSSCFFRRALGVLAAHQCHASLSLRLRVVSTHNIVSLDVLLCPAS